VTDAELASGSEAWPPTPVSPVGSDRRGAGGERAHILWQHPPWRRTV